MLLMPMEISYRKVRSIGKHRHFATALKANRLQNRSRLSPVRYYRIPVHVPHLWERRRLEKRLPPALNQLTPVFRLEATYSLPKAKCPFATGCSHLFGNRALTL